MISRIDIEDMQADQLEEAMASETVLGDPFMHNGQLVADFLVPGTYTVPIASKTGQEIVADIVHAYETLAGLVVPKSEIRLHPVDIMRLRGLVITMDDKLRAARLKLMAMMISEDENAPRLTWTNR